MKPDDAQRREIARVIEEIQSSGADGVALELVQLRESLDRIIAAYDAYRGKGYLPAPNEYSRVVDAINAAREQ